MPWCEGCARFLNPNTLQPDGTCPSCNRKVADQPAPVTEPESSAPSVRQEAPAVAELGLDHLPASETEMPKAPWHFKLLLVAAAVYLIWRFVQLAAVAL